MLRPTAFIAKTLERLEAGERVALVTIAARTGSAPRAPGAKMLVDATGRVIGTVGGGQLEDICIQQAHRCLKTGKPAWIDLSLDAAAAAGMLCGGAVAALVEVLAPGSTDIKGDLLHFRSILNGLHSRTPLVRVVACRGFGRDLSTAAKVHGVCGQKASASGDFALPPRVEDAADALLHSSIANAAQWLPNELGGYFLEPFLPAPIVYIFGAGHIAEALAPLCVAVGFETVVLDDRPEFANSLRFPDADRVDVVNSFAGAVDLLGIDDASYVVIATRGHAWDSVVLAAALDTRAGYIGMVGSHNKRDAVFAALSHQGAAPTALKRVHCPIGLDIGAETPEEIAVSIVAELIATRSGSTTGRMPRKRK